ncbi:MAG: UDP-glucose 4-epimerase GalE [Pseudomonadota bacterium]
MTILVTGGAGYIGAHAVLALQDSGENVVVLDNLSTGRRTMVPDGVPLVEGDVGDENLVRDILKKYGVRSVIHFAASIVVPDSVADPLGYYLNNTVKTRSLVSACVNGGVSNFIFSSTAAVYGNAEIMPVKESAPLAPVSPYGASKMMSERILQDVSAAYGLKYTILRYFNVAGADPKLRAGQATKNATHLIKVAVETALGKRAQIQVYGTDYQTPDGTCVRDYIHVSDLADFHLAALKSLQAGGENRIFNCGYGHGASVRDVIASVERVAGLKLKVVDAPRRAGDPASIVAGVSEIRAALKITPRFGDLDTIVAHALAFEKTL